MRQTVAAHDRQSFDHLAEHAIAAVDDAGLWSDDNCGGNHFSHADHGRESGEQRSEVAPEIENASETIDINRIDCAELGHKTLVQFQHSHFHFPTCVVARMQSWAVGQKGNKTKLRFSPQDTSPSRKGLTNFEKWIAGVPA